MIHFHHPRLRAASGAAAFQDVQAGYLYMTLTEATGNIWMIEDSDRVAGRAQARLSRLF